MTGWFLVLSKVTVFCFILKKLVLKIWNTSWIWVPSFLKDHVNFLWIVPILVSVLLQQALCVENFQAIINQLNVFCFLLSPCAGSYKNVGNKFLHSAGGAPSAAFFSWHATARLFPLGTEQAFLFMGHEEFSFLYGPGDNEGKWEFFFRIIGSPLWYNWPKRNFWKTFMWEKVASLTRGQIARFRGTWGLSFVLHWANVLISESYSFSNSALTLE